MRIYQKIGNKLPRMILGKKLNSCLILVGENISPGNGTKVLNPLFVHKLSTIIISNRVRTTFNL